MGGGGGGYTGPYVTDPRLMPKQLVYTDNVQRRNNYTGSLDSSAGANFFTGLNVYMRSTIYSSTTNSWRTVCDISNSGGLLAWYVSRYIGDGTTFQTRITVDGVVYRFNASWINNASWHNLGPRFVLGAGHANRVNTSTGTDGHFNEGSFQSLTIGISRAYHLQLFTLPHMLSLGMPLLRWESSLKIEEICGDVYGGNTDHHRAVAYYELDSYWS